MTESSSARWQVILSSFFMTWLLRFLSVIVQIVVPLYLVNSLGVSPSSAGFLISLIWIGNAAGALIAASLLRSWRMNVSAGLALLSLSFLFLTQPNIDVSLAGLLIFIAGLGGGAVQPMLAPVMHSASAGENRYRGVSLFSLALSLALVTGPSLSSFILQSYGGEYNLLFLIMSSLSFLGFISSFLVKANTLHASDAKEFILLALSVLRNKVFRYNFVLNFLYSLILPIILSFSGIVGQRSHGLGQSEVLYLISMMFMLSGGIRFLTFFVRIDASSVKRLLFFPLISLVVSSLLVAFSNSQVLFIAGMLLFSIAHALLYPWTLFGSFESVQRHEAVAAAYVFWISSGMAEFISPPLISLMMLLFGLKVGFSVIIIFSLASILWYLCNRRV